MVQADPSQDSDSEVQVATGHSWESHLSRLPTQKTLLTLRNQANSLKEAEQVTVEKGTMGQRGICTFFLSSLELSA